MWKDLLHYDKPIIVLGDPGQIPPIHGSSPLLINPDVKLTEVVRQASDSPILKLAMMAREGKVIPVGKYGHGVHVIYEDRLSDNLLMWADIILCGKNSTRDKINNYIRFELLNRKSDLPEKGDKIICRKNCWDISLPNEGTPLINGMIGFVENHIDKETISNKTFILDFKPEFSKNNFFNNLTVNRTMFEGTEEERKKVTVFSEGIKFEYGYAITTHLSQGSEWENVIIIEEFLGDYNYMKKWLYTAITRASKKLVIVRKRPKTYY
jgi:exodeoxyribonuclease-5